MKKSNQKTSGPLRVILAGAGHAHIAALRILSKNLPDAEFILVNNGEKAWYTGALPALIRGAIPPEQAYIDAAKLAQSCGARFIDAKFLAFENNRLHLQNTDPIPFDLLSLSTGATPNGGVKPIGQFLQRLETWAQTPTPHIGILGGGPAAIELALALRIRLGPKARIAISTPGRMLANAPPPVRRAALNHLTTANIPIYPQFPAMMDEILHAYTPEPVLRVRETLQLEHHDNVFATGDCAAFPSPLPRSGAIAVRQGHTLATNLRRALAGAPLQKFTPPRHTLAIFSLTPTTATAWYGNLFWTGRLAMTLKVHLDKTWVAAKQAALF